MQQPVCSGSIGMRDQGLVRFKLQEFRISIRERLISSGQGHGTV